MKRAVEVEIMGERLTLRTDSEESYVRSVAGYVDKKMQEIQKNTRPSAKSSIAMLAALNIADEYQKLKDHCDTVSQRLDRLLQKVINITEEG
jgi:cell division protein ZapA (FtsZ GTPase activity inhibitor)